MLCNVRANVEFWICEVEGDWVILRHICVKNELVELELGIARFASISWKKWRFPSRNSNDLPSYPHLPVELVE